METLEFYQEMAGSTHPGRFLSQKMSDGSLRASGILTARFQGNRDHRASLIIGIEEPETAFHPGAFAALRKALERASERKKVLITRHSPELLDEPNSTLSD